jgi:hypothetical protein
VENVDFMILVGLHIGHACKSNGENVMLVELLGVEAIHCFQSCLHGFVHKFTCNNPRALTSTRLCFAMLKTPFPSRSSLQIEWWKCDVNWVIGH